MSINMPKTTTAIGIFATGFTAGYLAFRTAGPLKSHLTNLKLRRAELPSVKILPEIPRLDEDARLTESELNLRLGE